MINGREPSFYRQDINESSREGYGFTEIQLVHVFEAAIECFYWGKSRAIISRQRLSSYVEGPPIAQHEVRKLASQLVWCDVDSAQAPSDGSGRAKSSSAKFQG